MDKLVDSERKNKEGDSELHTADEEHGASAVPSRKTTEKYSEWQSEQREREFKTKVSAWHKRSNKIKKLLPDSGDVLVLNHQRNAINDDMNSVFVAYNRLHEVASEMKADDIDKLLQIQNNNVLLLQDIRNRIYVIELEQAGVNSSESAKTAASQSSKRSKISGISNLSRKIDAATDTAILRAKLKYIEEEAKKRTELELIQTAKELEIAQAKLEAIAKVEHDERFADVEEYGEPPDESKRYVHQYVHSLKDPRSDKLPYDTVPRHDYYDNMTHPDRKPVAGINTYANEFVPVSMSVPRTHSDNEQTHSTYTHPTLPSNQLDGTPAKQTPLLPDCNNVANNTVNQQVIELTRLFAEQISLSRLPPPEPGIFTGEPLKFPGWKTAFERLIEHKGIPPLEQIYYLKKYLGGDAKAAVEGYFLLDTDTAFVEAKKLLEQRYGHPFVIADAFRNKMEQWPRIHPRDSIALRKFADFLQQCETAMYSVTSLKTLDDERENRKMLLKLPEWLALRWARYVADWRDRYNAFPQFTEFCKYVTKEANVACDPITSYATAGTNTQTRNIRGTVSFSTEVSENKTQTYSTKSSDPKLCLLCTKPHHIDDCRQFLSKSLSERKEFAKSNSLCFGCMQPSHRSKFCRQRRTCKTCSRRHPTSLHGDIRETNFSEQGVKYAESHAGTITRHGCTDLSTKCSMIVPVWVSHCDNPGVERMVYAMLDTQSDTTFILDYTCNKLGVDSPGVKLVLSTMLAKNQMVDSRKIDGLKIRGYDSLTTLSLPVTYTRGIMPCDRSHIPTPEVANQWPHLARISSKLLPLHDCEIGLLIGYNCSKALAPKDVIAPISNGPYAQLTELGWGIVGIVNPDKVESYACTHDPIGTSHRIVAYEVPPHLSVFDTISSEMCLPKCSDQVLVSFRTHVKEAIKPIDVTRMMELDFSEQESNCTPFSQEDQRFLKIMTNGIHQREDKHFEMPLPFKGSNIKLPNNRSMALHRLEQLKSRLIKNTQYYEDYRTFMQKVIVNGHAERVPEVEPEPSDGHTWYIPHHGVYHPKKPEKIRIVFDCSAKYKEESLNEHLLQGPDLTNALLGVLCRFRQDKIAIMCDIEQMFHQFRVNKEHRDFLRFLWWENGDYNYIPSVYRMNVHLFGAVSSPGRANFGLKHTATEYETECGATAADFLRHNFYVDDGLRSVESVHAALDLITSSKNMCAKGGLRLHKFVSNSKEVITAIPVEDCAEDIVQCDLGFDSLPVERALGVQWCIESDTFQFRIILKDQPLTRRGVLSTVSSIYDPLGFIAPVLLVGKRILQQMCRDRW